MRFCIKSTTTSFLVNGSPTIKFLVENDLKQGHLIAPLFFLSGGRSGGSYDGCKKEMTLRRGTSGQRWLASIYFTISRSYPILWESIFEKHFNLKENFKVF